MSLQPLQELKWFLIAQFASVKAEAERASAEAKGVSTLSSQVNSPTQTVSDYEPVPGPRGPNRGLPLMVCRLPQGEFPSQQ